MFTLLDLVQPDTLEEAYKTLISKRNNTVLGGSAFLRLSSKRISTAIDLSKLNLNYIEEKNNYIEIGAMTTFRELETNPLLTSYFKGILPKAIANIIGVQFRNVVTVGATVYSKYGFSDLITALMVLDTEVELYHGGRMRLEEFLDKPYQKDILTKLYIKKDERKAVYQNFRNSVSDYPILNVAISSSVNQINQWLIVVGARPLKAKVAHKASQELSSRELSKSSLSIEDFEYVTELAAEELSFGTNMRGSADYRKAICKVLVKRGIMEVLQCK